MAIDRDTIIEQIFNNTREPATGWVSPVVDGYKAGPVRRVLHVRRCQGQGLLDEAGGFNGGKLTLSYNADAAHKEWVDAACNSIKQTLGIECQRGRRVDFATSATRSPSQKMKGMLRTGWQMDYPSIENFLRRSTHQRLLERRRLHQQGLRQAGRRG